MKTYDVVIIGAGAAGLMCAAIAAKRRRRVLVLDHANKPGKKILMSGGGRCNFTNIYTEPQHFISENPHFCKSALARYTPWHFIELVESYKIEYHEKTKGQLFCNQKSRAILDMLLKECENNSAKVTCNTEIKTINPHFSGFRIQTSIGVIECGSLIVATGGLSIPTLGATGLGYELARQFGHSIIPTRPGLVPFVISDDLKKLCDQCSGIAINVSVACAGKQFEDPMLFTHRGLSGPAILQISNYWQPGASIYITLSPEHTEEDSFRYFIAESGGAALKTVLARIFPKRVAEEFCEYWDWPAELPAYQLTANHQSSIQQTLKYWNIKPSNTEGYRTAEVTLGGINTRELSSKSLMSNHQSGLFFIGEVVDVTGWLGGFNFQWAWASAVAAGNEC